MLGAIRDVAQASRARPARRPAAAPAVRAFREEIDPEGQGGAYLLGLRQLGVVAHGSFTRHGIARAICARGAAPRRISSVARTARSRPPARCGASDAGVRVRRYGRSAAEPMTRDEVLEMIRAHLADELELDPARSRRSTRFREDLAVDSLDLYTLVQELEDTYGIKVSDEQAVQLLTVEAAIDFVLSHAADR